MNTILNIIITVIILLVTGVIALQYKNFGEWLVYAVTEAEQCLGSGVGELKLRYVYDLAISKFPIVAKLIPYTTFKKLVDVALIKMKEMIATNGKIADLVIPVKSEGE